MILNLSNHPSQFWPVAQTNLAINTYKQIIDFPFPHISPNLNSEELNLMVEEFLEKIIEINPTAIHIMGELNFTFRLVNRLKSIGYRCLASTTERKVTEDGNGNKTSTFNFVQFRDY